MLFFADRRDTFSFIYDLLLNETVPPEYVPKGQGEIFLACRLLPFPLNTINSTCLSNLKDFNRKLSSLRVDPKLEHVE